MAIEAVSSPGVLHQNKPEPDFRAMSDLQLTQLIAKGDGYAFEEIYRRHHFNTYGLCLRMLNYNFTEAEDLTQDAYLQLYRKAATFKGNSQFSTWFHRLTINVVLLHFRKKIVRMENVAEEADGVEVIFNLKHNYREHFDLKRDIQSALDQMPPGYKQVFELHEIEGHEHKEVADIMGISEGTSKSQLHKAKLKLRKLIDRKANPRLVRIPA